MFLLMDMQRRNLFLGRNLSSSEVVHLPWLKSHELFYENCTRCEKCTQICPEAIVSQADGGFPAIDFKKGECTFCGKCAEVCPQPIFIINKKISPWDFFAKVDPSTCLSSQHISCRSCQDSCDYRAIKFTLKAGKTPYPEVNEDLCCGCGACVSRCPTYAIKIEK